MTSEDPKKAAKDVADEAGDRAAGVLASAKANVDATRDSARDLASRASDAAGEFYHDAKGRVRDMADRLPDASHAVDAGRKASDDVGRRVAKQPLEALLLAGAIGYLIGWATNRS